MVRPSLRNRLGLALALVAGAALVSCVTTTRNAVFAQADAGAAARDYLKVAQTLDGPDSPKYYGDKDQVLRHLDVGFLDLWGGAPAQAVEHLEEAETLIDQNYTKSLSNAAASFLINDYQLEYSGEVYEDLYVNVFKALAYLQLNRFDDAFVEINRLTTKLNVLEDKYGKVATSMNSSPSSHGSVKAGRTEFRNSALARYLSLLLYRADGRPDDAELDRQQVLAAFAGQPTVYGFAPPRAVASADTPTGPRLDVVAFTGQSPLKRANNLRINTVRNLVVVSTQKEDAQGRLALTQLAPLPFPGVEQGYNFKAELPEMVRRPSKVAQIRVLVDDVPAGNLDLIERIDAVGLEAHKLVETPILVKTVLRTVTKGIVTQKAKEQANQLASGAGPVGALLAVLGGFGADLLVDASEQADLRSARYLPGQAYVGSFAVGPGDHRVTVEYLDAQGAVLYRDQRVQTAPTTGLNLVTSFHLN